MSTTSKYIENLVKSVRWVKTSTLYIPESVIPPKKMASDLEQMVGVYVQYSEVFQGTRYEANTRSILETELRRFNFYELILTLAKLNYFLSEGHNRVAPVEREIIEVLFPKFSIERQRLLHLFGSRRKIFSRQQLLALMKLTILKNRSFKKGLRTKENLQMLGRMLFRMADFMEERINLAMKSTPEPILHEILVGNMVRNVYFNGKQQFRYTFTRYWTLFFEIASKIKQNQYPLTKQFEAITGLSLKQYMVFGFTIYAHYLNVKNSLKNNPNDFLIGKRYFQNVKDSEKGKAFKIFNRLVSNRKEFLRTFSIEDEKASEMFYSYESFFQKPLLEISEENYCLLDLQFLEEKITVGVYFEIIDSLRQRMKRARKTSRRKRFDEEKQKLNAFMGRCVELYVAETFKRIYAGSEKRLFSENGGDETGNIDFIIVYPETVFFIEVTTKALRHDTVFKGDIKLVDKEIKEIFFGSPNQRQGGKLAQLKRSIQGVLDNEVKLGINVKSIKTIVPVIITERGLPVFPGISNRFLSFIHEAGFSEDYWQNLQLWDLEELEMMEPLIQRGISLEELFIRKSKSASKNLFMKNYLLYNEKSNLNANVFLHEQLEKIIGEIGEMFFEKKNMESKAPLPAN